MRRILMKMKEEKIIKEMIARKMMMMQMPKLMKIKTKIKM